MAFCRSCPRIAALLVPLLLLPACRQDAVLKEAAAFKDRTEALTSAQNKLQPAIQDSCHRRAALNALSGRFRNRSRREDADQERARKAT
jgi:hypothetical protein